MGKTKKDMAWEGDICDICSAPCPDNQSVVYQEQWICKKCYKKIKKGK